MKNVVLIGIIGALAGFLIYPLLFGTAMWSGMTGTPLTADISRHFIEQMIPHHEDAIAMAGIALAKAEHPEIRQLAENIQRTQAEENDKMRSWYESWYGVDALSAAGMPSHGMMMHGGMMGDETDLIKLERAKPFDKEFIEQMIPHHQMAVMMASMVQRASTRPEIIQLAKDIISAQTKEINDMRSWYQLWY